MLTSEELGVERLNVGDIVYRFDWNKPLETQVCVGRISEIISTKELREGYCVENIEGYHPMIEDNDVFTRMDISKMERQPNYAMKLHIKDLNVLRRKLKKKLGLE